MIGLDLQMADDFVSANIDQIFEPQDFMYIKDLVLTMYRNKEYFQKAIEDTEADPAFLKKVKMLTGIVHDELYCENYNNQNLPTSLYCFNSIAAVDYLMLKIKPKIEEIVGTELVPKNHFGRIITDDLSGIYKLPYHVDHQGNDINLSINLLSDETNRDWPLYISDYDANVTENITWENQATVYSGRFPHWRNAYPGGDKYIQLFLHYSIKGLSRPPVKDFQSFMFDNITDDDVLTEIQDATDYVDFRIVKYLYFYLKDHIHIDAPHGAAGQAYSDNHND